MADNAQEKLQELFISYGKSLPQKISEIEVDWKQLNKEWQKELWEDFHRKIHTICGTSGTYGYNIVSQAARTLEIVVKELIGSSATDDQRFQIEALLLILGLALKNMRTISLKMT